jgi:quinol monooxygenase YgiN
VTHGKTENAVTEQATGTFGLIGQLRAVPGRRYELVSRLRDGARDVPGKLAYLIALDRNDPDSLWITEIWRDEQAYDACVARPGAEVAGAALMELIASAGPRIETIPLPAA